MYWQVGEAPEDIRSVLQQRSRWAKGHFQVMFFLQENGSSNDLSLDFVADHTNSSSGRGWALMHKLKLLCCLGLVLKHQCDVIASVTVVNVA